MEVETETTNNVMCLLTDPEGIPFEAPTYLPQNACPQQLSQIVYKLLCNIPSKSTHLVLIIIVVYFFLLC